MILLNHLKYKKKTIGAIAGLFAVVLLCFGILPNVFAASNIGITTSGEVVLDGTNDGSVSVVIYSGVADTIHGVQATFQPAVGDSSNTYLTLNALTPGGSVEPTSNETSDGIVYWLDGTLQHGFNVAANGAIWTGVYTVDKDTPAGNYEVSVPAEIITAGADYDAAFAGTLTATVTVTRNDAPVVKPSQVVTFRDGNGNPITGLTQWYGDEDIVITKEVTTGDGVIFDYHPDDDGSGTIAHTSPDSDLVGFGEPGSVEICAWVRETDNYAETKACYTVEVTKRPIGVIGATITNKTYDGTRDAEVTAVEFSNHGNGTPPTYTVEGTFGTADAGVDKAVRVDVTLTGEALEHYTLSPSYLNTTKTISPFVLDVDGVRFSSGETTYGYVPGGVEPEVTVTANIHGGTSTLTKGTDYQVEYVNNSAAGYANAIVTGMGNYTTDGPGIVLPFVINKAGIRNDDVIVPSSIVEGRILEADDVSVVVNGYTLTRCATDGEANCDYVLTISGDNDGEIGHTVHVAVNGRNNYDGAGVADVSIVAKLAQTVTIADVTNTIVNKTYGDEDFTYTATTSGNGEIRYSSTNESVATVDGNGRVSIVGVGDADIYATALETPTYAEGAAKYTVHVDKKVITVTGATVATKTYDGSPVATVSDVTLSEGSLVFNTDFTATGLFNDITPAVRNVNVMVSLTDDAYVYYCFMYESNCIKNTSYSAVGTITAFGLSGDTATAELVDESVVYNGLARCTSATVKADLDGDGIPEAPLTVGTDYDVVCDSNVNVGTANVAIVGKRNYTGSLSNLHFTITAAPVTNVVVTAPAQDYTGEALEPVPTVTGDVNGVNQTFNPGDYYIIAHAGFINAGEYTFSVKSVSGGNYYFDSTDGTFTINKVSSGMPPESTQNLRIEAGRTLADLGTMSEGFTWTHPDDAVALGSNSYYASYIRDNDATNYSPTITTVSVYGLKRIEVITALNDGGNVMSPGNSALEGETLTWTFVPGEGAELGSVWVNSEDKTSEVSNNQFSMIAGTEDIVAIVRFRRVYEFVNEHRTHVKGVDGAAEFEIDADYELFEDDGKLYVDGELLDEENYRTWSGSTMIELSADYLESLAAGEHALLAEFDDGGVARTTFTITDPSVPDEAEPSESAAGVADTGAFTGTVGGAVAAGFAVTMFVGMAGAVCWIAVKNKRS